MAAKCSVKTVNIKRKGSQKIIASFKAHVGSGCPKRKKSSYKTGHLKLYKDIMRDAAPSCRRRFKPFTKPYGKCIKDAFRAL